MKRFLFISCLLITIVTYSQSFEMNSLIENTSKVGILKGFVTDNEENKEPLAFANITVKETLDAVTSNLDGSYSISLKPGIYTLEFSFIGYKTTLLKEVVVEPNKTINYNLSLSALTLESTLVASNED